MGGIGKSWRRVWHKGTSNWHPGFMTSYTTRAIGCHWQEGDWLDNFKYQPYQISTVEDLANFLNELHQFCREYMGQNASGYLNWKEAWHPKRLQIYAQVVDKSQLIQLFHNEIFKTTPAIGGRQPKKDKSKKDNPPTSFSSVWHRMLPIEGSNQYLEIITLFTNNNWKRKSDDENLDQLQSFIKAIEAQKVGNKNFTKLVWGKSFQA